MEHSEYSSPSKGKRRLNEDTISSLPRKSYQVTMTGGIVYQGASCATLMSEPGADESFNDEDSRKNNRSERKLQEQQAHSRFQKVWKHMDEEGAVLMEPESTNSQLKVSTDFPNNARKIEMKRKEKQAKARFQKVWKHMDEEGALITEPESTKSPLNISTDSTMEDSSVEEFGELASDSTREHSEEEEKLYGYDRNKFLCLLAVCLTVLLISVTIPTAVIATQKEEIATPPPSVSMSPSISPSVSMMPSDEPSMVPTDTFKPSDLPSNVPSTVPSNAPTDTYKPSDRPSDLPSLSMVPSVVPSNSMVPSSTPSMVPTDTQSPSRAPTKLPSVVPSVSMEPTFTPVDPNWRFKLRLYWSPEYFWQEETEERFWCLECVPCAEYGRDDGWKHGCDAYPNGLNHNCKAGDSVWIRDCRWYGNEYNVLQKHKAGFTLRLHNTNLCVERRNKHLMMKQCNINDPDQQFVAWGDFSKFELIPLAMEGKGEREADCVSQLHHPKSEEVVGMHNCRLCRHFETRYWEIYK